MKNKLIAAILTGFTVAAFAAPISLTQSVSYDGETVTMQLTKQDLRGSEFELWSQNASGGYDVITPVDERSYMGTVDGYPGAVSCGILQDDGQFRGAVYFDRGVTWFTLGTTVVETRALDYSTYSAFQTPSAPSVGAGQAGSTMYAYDLGVDADYDYFNRAGNNVAKAFEGIEYSVCVVRAIYMRDALLRPYLGRVIIRATLAQDPYTGLSQGDYLNALRTEWNTNHTGANSDLVSGASPTKIGGGLAWVGVVGSSSGYSVNQSNSSGNFDVVFRHEMGHNWGCGHFVGGSPEGKGIMGGNAPARFSGCELYRVLNHRTSRVASLDDEGTYTAIELPPYASMDVGEFIQTLDSSVTFNVLANDHDANGQAVSLDSYDGASANGGTVTQQGQNLIYAPPGAFLGTDYFTYTITDTAGRTAKGVVIVDVQPNDLLRLYLPLDETSGTLAHDQSAFENDGTLSGTDFSASVAGKYANAINLDGIDDHVEVSNVRLNANTVTLTAWVKQGATQNGWAGIVFDRSTSASGLNAGDAGELRYHWNGGQWGWNSGLTPPTDTWTFVALVVEPSKATIYMNSGSGFQTAVHSATHAAATFGTTYIGWDTHSSPRHFKGAIDEVRIYNYSMSETELQGVYDGGGAESPSPFDGAGDVESTVLRWSAGATATAHDVYIGTSQAAVASATKTSSEYKETTPVNLFRAALADQTPYYWRIDTVTASTTLPGSVWSFTTGTVQDPGNMISVNFEQSSNQDFSGGEMIGPLFSDSTYWNATSEASGSLADLIDNIGTETGVDIAWDSSTTYWNSDGTGDDEHRLSVGYLDDGNSGSGDGVTVTISNIPYTAYRVYGLYASGQSSSAMQSLDFNVNGTWVYGGSTPSTTTVYGNIDLNRANHGEYWTEIAAGTVIGNYWSMVTTGTTCSITGRVRLGNTRGSLTGVIIEKLTDTDGDGIPNEVDDDDDNDGIPDDWETDHGLNPLVDDASRHSDLDQYNNWFEYVTDTDPLDGNSWQTFSFEIDPSTGEPTARFSTSVNRLYTVRYRANLVDGAWQDLDSSFPGTGSEMTVPDPAAGTQRFYRLRIELP